MPDPLAKARAEAEQGMDQAGEHADQVYPGWREEAYEFLVSYAERHPFFISEDVSDATKDLNHFVQPPTDRAWGSVYRRAIKERIIERAGTGISRRRHASICPKWRSLVCWRRETNV